MMGYYVFCQICGHGWDERDPSVRYRYGDGVWECEDEAACFDRRAVTALEAPPGTFGGAA